MQLHSPQGGQLLQTLQAAGHAAAHCEGRQLRHGYHPWGQRWQLAPPQEGQIHQADAHVGQERELAGLHWHAVVQPAHTEPLQLPEAAELVQPTSLGAVPQAEVSEGGERAQPSGRLLTLHTPHQALQLRQPRQAGKQAVGVGTPIRVWFSFMLSSSSCTGPSRGASRRLVAAESSVKRG